jgi:hypothetical protein
MWEISTTNAVEAWHRKIKSNAKGVSSIQETLLRVVECSDDYLKNAAVATAKFRLSKNPICSDFPGLHLEKFPSPIQDLLLDQVNDARTWYDADEPLHERLHIPGWRTSADPQGSSVSLDQSSSQDIPAPHCECGWYRSWQLPCAHIWHHHLLYRSLMPAHFAQLANLWSKNGYEIYEETRQAFQEASDNIVTLERSNLGFRVNVDTLVDKFYGLASWLERKGVPPEWREEGLRLFQDYVSGRLADVNEFSLERWYQHKLSSQRTVNK